MVETKTPVKRKKQRKSPIPPDIKLLKEISQSLKEIKEILDNMWRERTPK